MYWVVSAVSVVFLLTCAQVLGEEQYAPYPVDWKSDGKSPVDLSFLLDAPAGKGGFIKAIDGHLSRPDGRRLRIWGVNASVAGGLPASQNAPLIAARLAQSGVNCVRFHFFDRLAPNGIIDAAGDDTRRFDAAQLDRLDFFVAELKKRGIYTNLNLNVARSYKAGDGVRDHELLGFAKAVTYFDPRLIELQKEYARMLLTHRNPYTQAEYRNEPAVAIVELVNENSLLESWFSGRLLGKNTTKNPGTWTDIPAAHEKALTDLYNAWLRARLSQDELANLRTEAGVGAGDLIPRLRPEEFAKASKMRFLTEATFYMETERRYFQDMAKHLREDLGLKALLVGSGDHNHGRSGYAHLSSTSLLDVVDGHVYWQHPNEVRDQATGRRKGFWIGNSAMVDDPLHSTVVQLSRSAVAGKPYTVSEVGHPFPSDFACEGIPILAAYAALHDWDGILWYSLSHADPLTSPQAVTGHFDLYSDPVKMAQLAAGALIFLRPDIRPSRQTITRSYTREQVLDGLRLPWRENPYFTPGFDLATPLTHATRIQSFDGPPTGAFDHPPTDPIRCDTGELIWHHTPDKQGMLAIDTDRSQALIGHLAARQPSTRNLAVRVDTPFCAITLSSLDDKPIAQSSRLLLTTGARVANTGMQWDAKRHSLDKWGGPPSCIEPVTGTVVLRGLEAVRDLNVRALDGAGNPLGRQMDCRKSDDGWVLEIGKPPAVWYVLECGRPPGGL